MLEFDLALTQVSDTRAQDHAGVLGGKRDANCRQRSRGWSWPDQEGEFQKYCRIKHLGGPKHDRPQQNHAPRYHWLAAMSAIDAELSVVTGGFRQANYRRFSVRAGSSHDRNTDGREPVAGPHRAQRRRLHAALGKSSASIAQAPLLTD